MAEHLNINDIRTTTPTGGFHVCVYMKMYIITAFV